MRQFINLTSIVINKLHITEIVKKPGKYYIYLNNSSINGVAMFGYKSITTIYNIIEVCETKNKADYETVKGWINTIK